MRVPDTFYNKIKSISDDRKQGMSQTLRDSERILENAEYLSKIIYGRFKSKKR